MGMADDAPGVEDEKQKKLVQQTSGGNPYTPQQLAEMNKKDTLGTVADSFGEGGFANNAITKNNPLAGTVNAIGDVAQGDYAGAVGDFAQGASNGTLPIPGQTGLVPPVQDIADGIANGAGSAADAIGNVLTPAQAGPGNGGLDASVARSNAMADKVAAERAGLKPTAAPLVGNVQVDPTQIDPLRQQQGDAIRQIAAAAAGQTPSPAELQAKQQAERAASQQFGQAAALRGGMSSGGALRQASQGAAQVLGDVANQGAVLRAGEQANARQQLVGALAGVRGQEQDLGTTNAGLTQQGNLANQNSKIQTTGQDFDWQKALLSGEGQANQTAEQAAASAATAEAQRIASENAYKGAIIGAGGSILGNLVKK
jgi:hypothetical protein